MKELIDELSYDLAECHKDYLDDAKLWTDYDTMAQKLISRGYRRQREGKWIWKSNGYMKYLHCSCCGRQQEWKTLYCPNCGAKMKGGAE